MLGRWCIVVDMYNRSELYLRLVLRVDIFSCI